MKKTSKYKFIRDIVIVLVVGMLLSVSLRAFFVQPYLIPSASMENTLQINDHILASTFALTVTGVHRGDIVVFTDPGGWLTSDKNNKGVNTLGSIITNNIKDMFGIYDSEYLIKRVIGLPGDKVSCAGAGAPLKINGVSVGEPYTYENEDSSDLQFELTVSPDCYFVLGDHRSNSADSRWKKGRDYDGLVPRSHMVGKAFAIMSPLNRLGFLKDYGKVFDNVK